MLEFFIFIIIANLFITRQTENFGLNHMVLGLNPFSTFLINTSGKPTSISTTTINGKPDTSRSEEQNGQVSFYLSSPKKMTTN